MARWDIDRDLRPLEPEILKGTSFQRIMVSTQMILNPQTPEAKRDFGHIKLSPEVRLQESQMIWCLGIGYAGDPKAFFYGTTIREAYLQARKAVKLQKLAEHTPWSRQAFTPSLRKKPKKKEKRPRTKKDSS